jgi:hypothetical protein
MIEKSPEWPSPSPQRHRVAELIAAEAASA